MNTTIAFT